MKYPQRILRQMKIELRTKTDKQLNETLIVLNNKLKFLQITENEANFQYYSYKIKQKINLIKNELKTRQQILTNDNQV